MDETICLEKLKKWVILISTSSWDKEFNAINFREWDEWIHDDILYNWTILILNWWFPINFDGSPVSVPSEKIQITRGIVYCAIYQITTTELNAWLNELYLPLQNKLIQIANKLWIIWNNSAKSFNRLS